MNDAAYRDSLIKCADRYGGMALHIEGDLWEFTNLFRESVEKGLPLLKMNRWLGYIQGMLIAKGVTTVEAERDWTRPLFRPLDFD